MSADDLEAIVDDTTDERIGGQPSPSDWILLRPLPCWCLKRLRLIPSESLDCAISGVNERPRSDAVRDPASEPPFGGSRPPRLIVPCHHNDSTVDDESLGVCGSSGRSSRLGGGLRLGELQAPEPDDPGGLGRVARLLRHRPGKSPARSPTRRSSSSSPRPWSTSATWSTGRLNPIVNPTPLVGQNPSIESLEVDFSNASGQIYPRTRFDFSLTRTRGYEAGEYKVSLETSDGTDVGTPTTIILKGDNPVVDRRAMSFDAKNPNMKKIAGHRRRWSPQDRRLGGCCTAQWRRRPRGFGPSVPRGGCLPEAARRDAGAPQGLRLRRPRQERRRCDGGAGRAWPPDCDHGFAQALYSIRVQAPIRHKRVQAQIISFLYQVTVMVTNTTWPAAESRFGIVVEKPALQAGRTNLAGSLKRQCEVVLGGNSLPADARLG